MVSKNWKNAIRGCVWTAAILAVFPRTEAQSPALTGRDYAVELTANIAENPAEITLSWPRDGASSGYTIKRKAPDSKQWERIAEANGIASAFIDRNIQPGVTYEYQVIKDSSLGLTAYGYIQSGINLPLVEDRGTVVLVIESSLAQVLESELLRLEFDLMGDGWTVERAIVSATASPREVKDTIKSIYAKDPARTRSLLLFGHVPVPYSGNIMPDGHENHMGAWPADLYYGDLDGTWTDETVNTDMAESSRHWNFPGDGKFDQNEPPSEMELQVGRVDLSKLTSFLNKTPSRSEIDLARQYLDKNHRFRTGQLAIQQRAIIFDRIESKTAEPVAAMAWRNFAPFVGSNIEKIADLQYFPKVSSGSYLWSSVTAGGGYTSSDHVGTSDAFALNDANVVFTTFLGSYYGDWDVESAFLRAALGARGALLTAVYSGQPQWLFHPMALGETIGYSAKLTQENGVKGIYPPHNNGAGEVHVALLGDPTLRAHPIPSVQNVRAEVKGSGMVVGWQVPQIDGLIGFVVYRSANAKGPYQKVNSSPITQPFLTIPEAKETDTFMVKAVALTRSPSGSYYNSSVGAFYPDPTGGIQIRPPEPPSSVSIANVNPTSVTLAWVGGSARISGFRIERKDPGATQFKEIASTSFSASTYEDRSLKVPGTYIYRVRAFNQAGNSGYSGEAVASTLVAQAEFVGTDETSQGTWIGNYGSRGHLIPIWDEQKPAALSMTTSNVIAYGTALTDDKRGLELPDSPFRSANCWVAGAPFAFHLNFTDDQTYQVAFYMAAWSKRNPPVGIEIFDAVSGRSLDQRTFNNIDEGVYAVYNLRRQVYVRINPPSIYTNAEIYGIFFDAAKVAPVQIQPASGVFSGRTQVTLNCPTPGATVYYTTDGSEPTQNSSRYTDPFVLRSTTQLRARAFRDGFQSSPIAEAAYSNSLSNLAGLISFDHNTAGTWPDKYGSEGLWLPMSAPALPGWAEVSVQPSETWTWGDNLRDPRALLVRGSSEIRQARAWYNADSMIVRVGAFDTRMHSLSLYFVDFDYGSRIQDVEVLDLNGDLKDRFRIEGFENGKYLTLAVQGEFLLRISKVKGPNAVLNGIFFDPAPVGLSPAKAAPLTALAVTQGILNFSMEGFPGSRVCMDLSRDLVQWECFSTNTISGSSVQFEVPVSNAEKGHFFRTHIVP